MKLHARLLGLCLSLAATSAGATVYHVAQKDAGCSDVNSGTADKPWKTISRAAKELKAGDTVIVHEGIYREYVQPINNGTIQAPIFYTTAPGEKVIITGADILTGWMKDTGDAPIYQIPWTSVHAVGFENGKPVEHHPADAPLWGRAEQTICDGVQLLPVISLADLKTTWAAHVKAGKPVKLAPPLHNLGGSFNGRFYADTINKKLYVWLPDGSDPNTHSMEGSTRSMCFGDNQWARPAGYTGIRVHGFTFRYAASFPQRGAVWLGGNNNLVEDCIIDQMSGGGISVNGQLLRTRIIGCGQTGGAAMGTAFENVDCVWQGNCWKPIPRGWDAGGVKLALVSDGIFNRCDFIGNGGPGLWFDINVHNVTVTNCRFIRNEGSGLFIEISRDITVSRNLFAENATGAVGEGDKDWGSGGLMIAESQDCTVTFNTSVLNKDGITIREQGPRPLDLEDPGQPWKTIPFHNFGHVIVGNVSAFNRGYQLGIWYDNAFFGWHPAEKDKYKTDAAYKAYLATIPDKIYDPVKQSMTIDRNLYYASKGQHLVLYGVNWRPGSQVFDGLTAFTSKTGFESSGLMVDPLIMDMAAGDYRFKADSPAIKSQLGWLSPRGEVLSR